MPVPLSATTCVPPLSVIVIAPVRAPAAAGVNVTEIVHCPGLATVARQLLVSLKSPLALMVVIARLLVPVFESVTVCVVLAIPTVWLPKFSIDGESPTPGAVPVPVSARTNWPVPVPTV